MNSKREKKLINNNGITLVALSITIIVLLILAGISIGSLTGNNGIIKNAKESEIRLALSEVREGLEQYVIKEGSKTHDGNMSNESIVGTIYTKTFIEDTYREVGIIKADTINKELNSGTKLGKSKQKDSIQEAIENNELVNLINLYELYDVFVVDFDDNTLYYVQNDNIWSLEGTKSEYTLSDGNIVENYKIEQLDEEYLEKRKFITQWEVATGEEVILPLNTYQTSYNCSIEWGDGEKTEIKHNVTIDGVKYNKTNEELASLVTHKYNIDSENNIRTIKISGTYERFTTSTWPQYSVAECTKEKLIGITQWGKINAEILSFGNCVNLRGNIPDVKIEGAFQEITEFSQLFYNCKNLTGQIPEELFESAVNNTTFNETFSGCEGLTGKIPENIFKNSKLVTNFSGVFKGCKNLTGKIPSDLFQNNVLTTSFSNAFSDCTSLDGEIPEDLFKTCTNVTNFSNTFYNWVQLKEIPEKLFENNIAANDFANIFYGCTGITSIPKSLFFNCANNASFGTTWNGAFQKCTGITEIPVELFSKQTETTSIGGCFSGCTGITSIPENLFINNKKVKNFSNTFSETGITEIPENLFSSCPDVTEFLRTFMKTKIERIPTNLFANNTEITTIDSCFYATNVKKIQKDLFKNNNKITNMSYAFYSSKIEEIEEGFRFPESVQNIRDIFHQCGMLMKIPNNFEIGLNITNTSNVFRDCRNLKGTILIKGNIQNFGYMFFNTAAFVTDGTLTINYTSNCTNIDDIIATKNSEKVLKGQQI